MKKPVVITTETIGEIGEDMALGETTYQRFKRMIDSLPEYEQANFTSRIIYKYRELHDLELRDVLLEVWDGLQKDLKQDAASE